jgi:hypothetical protein
MPIRHSLKRYTERNRRRPANLLLTLMAETNAELVRMLAESANRARHFFCNLYDWYSGLRIIFKRAVLCFGPWHAFRTLFRRHENPPYLL